MNNGKPILVTGSHRSGTTWIGQTIAQHPRVRYVHEPFSVSDPNPIAGLRLDTWFSHFPSSHQKQAIIATFNDLLRFDPLTYAATLCRAAGGDVKTPLRFAKYFLSELLFRPRILIKDPIALYSAGWLHERYHFKVVVTIRNPFAFVGSLKKAGWDFPFEHLFVQSLLMQGWLKGFAADIAYMSSPEGKSRTDLVDRAALLWNVLHAVILEYRNSYPGWLFVRHEDISMNPAAGFQRIFDYLDLELNGRILRYIERYTSDGNPKETTDASYQPRDSLSILETWKERLSRDEIERVKSATNDLASQFYENIS